MAVKQTAGREALGEFAPKFAQLNDDVLFGEVWSREDALSLRDRSLVTVTALMAQGLTDPSFQYHLMAAKQNGITKTEIAEILTHAAFYAGWSKAWAAFRMGEDFRNLGLCDAVLLCRHQMVLKRRICQALGHQSRYRDQRAIPQRQLFFSAPHFSKKHVIIELGEFGSELSQAISACCLFDCHKSYFLSCLCFFTQR